MVRYVVLNELSHEVKEQLREFISKLKIPLDDVVIIEYDVVPMRIQHIVNELSKNGYILAGTIVINGRFFTIALKKSDKDLGLALDYSMK